MPRMHDLLARQAWLGADLRELLLAPAQLVVSWTEHDGPPIPGGLREGFGTNFIRRSVECELGGSVVLEFPETGTRCTVTVPPEHNIA